MPFEPGDGLGIEVVGRLVEQQQFGLLEQQLAERDAAALTARELVDRPIVGRAAQGVHGLLDLANRGPRGPSASISS